VNRETLVRVDDNQYSVPVGHGGQAVDVRMLRDVIRISRDGVPLAEHARLTGTGQRPRDPDHYAPALPHRPRAPRPPQAPAGSRPLRLRSDRSAPGTAGLRPGPPVHARP